MNVGFFIVFTIISFIFSIAIMLTGIIDTQCDPKNTWKALIFGALLFPISINTGCFVEYDAEQTKFVTVKKRRYKVHIVEDMPVIAVDDKPVVIDRKFMDEEYVERHIKEDQDRSIIKQDDIVTYEIEE